MHYGEYDLLNMQEIMPGLYAGPAPSAAPPLYAGPWAVPANINQPGAPQRFQSTVVQDCIAPNGPGLTSFPIPVAPGPSGLHRRTPNIPIPSAGPARVGSYSTQIPGRAPPSVGARAHAHGPARTTSQYAQQPIPSSQSRTTSHQVPGRAGSFLGPANANSHRIPSFQGRSSSYLGPVPRNHARAQPTPSFGG